MDFSATFPIPVFCSTNKSKIIVRKITRERLRCISFSTTETDVIFLTTMKQKFTTPGERK